MPRLPEELAVLVDEPGGEHQRREPLAVDTAGGPAWGSTIADFRAPVFARVEGSAQSTPPGYHPWRVALSRPPVRLSATR